MKIHKIVGNSPFVIRMNNFFSNNRKLLSLLLFVDDVLANLNSQLTDLWQLGDTVSSSQNVVLIYYRGTTYVSVSDDGRNTPYDRNLIRELMGFSIVTIGDTRLLC